MLIGICSNMFMNREDPTGLRILPVAESAGFDYIEAPAAQLLALKPETLERQIETLLASPLPCLALNNLFQATVRITGPDAANSRIDEYTERVLDLAGRLGVRVLVFGSAAARNVPYGFPPDRAWEQAAETLRRLGPKAEQAGITVVIEHINRLEGNLIATFREGMDMLREVNLPSVRGLVDYFHLGLGNESLDAVESHLPLVRHAHFANLLGRSLPTTKRHDDGVTAYLSLLREKGYIHGVSCEGYSDDPEREIPEAAEYMSRYK